MQYLRPELIAYPSLGSRLFIEIKTLFWLLTDAVSRPGVMIKRCSRNEIDRIRKYIHSLLRSINIDDVL
jgi:hypothetical protein